MLLLFEFSEDFRIAFISFSALLGVLLTLLGIVLAVAASKARNRDRDATQS
jgi:hypothetical protein